MVIYLEKLFKGPKLTKISPNKTYAGVLVVYLLSIIFLSFYKLIIMNKNFELEKF